ncbi:glycoside hydrolase family 3 C-terminal domain-containing protein [Prolixibacteraceae bacterium Z1-6]|uniref:Glycoside hydrolase family 3 C-terminal domain-containing protein n=1 Tax=Draconibacterium aestuarii TaxID=2998507 RepID=A0A9X3FHB6_9BACT|nr:glycoside hydrolase family 3 C-terminal domain-containing protein [Prolixibacteraceae bacterium Z1-6]
MMNKTRLLKGTLILIAVQLILLSCSEPKTSKSTPVLGKDNVEAVISAMTSDEKIGMTVGDGKFLPKYKGEVEQGTGVIIANQQANMVIPRLSVRRTALTDGPSGINRDPHPEGAKEYTYTTAFPTSTCLAASWNTELIEEVGDALGNELLEYNYDLILMPALNLHRNPKCGRNFEYYSEDPLLSGKLAASMVRGIQSNGVGSTLKHFVGNNQESNRRNYNAVISQRALREIYLRGFEIAVREASPAAIMTAYNRVNGFYTAENPELLQDIVRKDWGYKGLFMTDFDGYGSAVAKVRAGNNMLMGGNMDEVKELTAALKDKTLDETTLDKNLVYNMELKAQSPGFKGYVASMKPDLDAHAKIAREAAGEGMVLLKNENNTLPLTDETTVALFGKIGYYLIEAGTGSGGVRSNKYAVSVYDGLKAAGFSLVPGMEKSYTDFIEKTKRENLVPDYFNNPKMRADNGITGNQAPPHFKKRLVAFSREQAVPQTDIAKYEAKSDVAVITLGRSGGENYENGYLPISEIELNLVKDVCKVYHSAGKKVIVVLNVGGVWETVSWNDYPDAILLAWQPGQEGGHAVADILKGKVNPSGKLPDSFPLKYEDVPSAETFPGEPAENPVNSFYTEGIYVGYRYYDSFDVPTAYEFGFGLSYTTFEYVGLQLSSTDFSGKMTFSLNVKNTGKVAGKEVVQLYLSAPASEIDKPVQELKGFTKTKLLQPGESQQITFTLDKRSLASFRSGISAWVADKGEYEVRIGASSKDIRLSDSFMLTSDLIVEKVNDVLYPNFMIEELKSFRK